MLAGPWDRCKRPRTDQEDKGMSTQGSRHVGSLRSAVPIGPGPRTTAVLIFLPGRLGVSQAKFCAASPEPFRRTRASSVSGTSRSRRGRLDMATCYLVKEVLDEHWSVRPTALRLSVLVGDDLGLLCQLRARLRRASSRRRTELTRRALATLDVALMGYATPGMTPLTYPDGRRQGRALPGLLGPGQGPRVGTE